MALFGIEINDNLVSNEDLLVDKLYKFLSIYIPLKLKTNTKEDREDATQEVIMYILLRLREEKKVENLERYIYNRARSYISSYIIRPKQRENELRGNFYLDQLAEQFHEIYNNDKVDAVNYINEDKLVEIIDKFPISVEGKEQLLNQTIYNLVNDYGFYYNKENDQLINIHNEVDKYVDIVMYKYAEYLNRLREGR